MNRRNWLIGILAFVTAIAVSLGLLQGHSSSTAVAQSPAPSPIPSLSEPTPAPSPSAPADPTAPASPAPTVAPAPLPVPAAPTVEPEFEPLPLSGNYEDESGLFQVGILEGFTVNKAGAAPLFEASDGNVAYTVAIAPIDFNSTPRNLSNEALVRVTERVFGRGEGFRIQSVGSTTANGGVPMGWIGSLTVGGKTQPMQGSIIARQAGSNVVLLLVAATESGAETLTSVTGTLAESLEIAQG